MWAHVLIVVCRSDVVCEMYFGEYRDCTILSGYSRVVFVGSCVLRRPGAAAVCTARGDCGTRGLIRYYVLRPPRYQDPTGYAGGPAQMQRGPQRSVVANFNDPSQPPQQPMQPASTGLWLPEQHGYGRTGPTPTAAGSPGIGPVGVYATPPHVANAWGMQYTAPRRLHRWRRVPAWARRAVHPA